MDITPFAQGNHSFGKRPDGFGLGQSRLDSIVLDKAANLVRQQKIPMLGFTTQFNRLLQMTHKFLERNQFTFIAPFHTHRRLY